MKKKRLMFCLSLLIIIAGTVTGIVLYRSRIRRVSRQHADGVPPEYEYLVKRIDCEWRGNTWLDRKDTERDLDEVEWLLENRFSYLKRRPVDYKAALDSVRSSLGRSITRAELAVQLQKVLCLFGDGHSMVSDPTIKRMGWPYLPFLVACSRGRVVAFTSDHSGFLSEDHPYIAALDGVDLEEWFGAADQIIARGSRQFVDYSRTRRLRYIGYLRKELSLPPSESLRVELESHDGQRRQTLNVELAAECPDGCWPDGDVNEPIVRILEEDIGYLRIAPLMFYEQQYQEALVKGMNTLRRTRGLIIDVRDNSGGSRAPLRTLFPFFLAPNATPKVLNVAAYRLGHRKDILDVRWLYPADWKGWSDAEREVITRFAKTFAPEWELPEGQFSEWHYLVIGPSTAPGYYHYDKPVVVLMNSTNFSATDIFLGAFKGHPNVTLMGTPSGGGSGRARHTWLHNSSIRVSLSSMASFRPSGLLYEDRGIQPDIVMEPEPGYFIGQSDDTLRAAIKVLRTKQD